MRPDSNTRTKAEVPTSTTTTTTKAKRRDSREGIKAFLEVPRHTSVTKILNYMWGAAPVVPVGLANRLAPPHRRRG